MIPIFVCLDNIKELKEIFTLYILTALKEKYMETYQRRCLDEINEEYKQMNIKMFTTYRHTISHYKMTGNCWYHNWTYNIADFPEKFIYSSGLNCPNGFKEYGR